MKKFRVTILKTAVKHIAIILMLLSMATTVGLIFRANNVNEANILMTYLIAVIFVAYLVENFIISTITAVLAIMVFSFFFAEPYFSIIAYRSDYPMTYLLMFVGAILTSSLTIKLRREAKAVAIQERRASLLYELSQKLLWTRDYASVADVAGMAIANVLETMSIVSFVDAHGKLDMPRVYFEGNVLGQYEFSAHHYSAMQQAYRQNAPRFEEEKFYHDIRMYYVPIRTSTETLGVLGFRVNSTGKVDQMLDSFSGAVATQMTMALERERLSESSRLAAVQIEREQLRGNLLRAISHDLRTPLTGILGTISTIMANSINLEIGSNEQLLQNAYDDAQWLINTIENILSMTQLEEGQLRINMRLELVEEIMETVMTRASKLLHTHQFQVSVPSEPITILADAHLLMQVLYNLLDNATKFSPPATMIEINVSRQSDFVVFRVTDKGMGIQPEAFEQLFNRFFTYGESVDRGRRGIGLGLEICKAIVEAHGGSICAYNNGNQGATFEFTIPRGELLHEV